jgi:hypothetical protein
MLTPEDALPRPRDSNVKELFSSSSDMIGELKKMNRSLCFSFLELLDILLTRPNAKLTEDSEISIFDSEKYNEDLQANRLQEKFAWEIKIQQIHLLLINMSYLLNSYRPQQARQQLISILEDSLKKRQNATLSMKETLDLCTNMLKETKDVLSSNDQQITTVADSQLETENTTTTTTKKRKRDQEEDETTKKIKS